MPCREIAPITDHPDFAEAAAILRQLETGAQEIQREIDRLSIEHHLARQPGDPRAPALKARLGKLQPTSPKVAENTRPANDMPDKVAAALAILAGTPLLKSSDRKTRIVILREHGDIVAEAICVQARRVAEIRGSHSAKFAKGLRDEHDRLALEAFRAMQALAAAVDKQVALRAAVHAAGFEWRDDLLPVSRCRIGVIAGSEADFDSAISRYRRELEHLGILK